MEQRTKNNQILILDGGGSSLKVCRYNKTRFVEAATNVRNSQLKEKHSSQSLLVNSTPVRVLSSVKGNFNVLTGNIDFIHKQLVKQIKRFIKSCLIISRQAIRKDKLNHSELVQLNEMKVLIGLAGLGNQQDKKRLRNYLRKFFPRLTINVMSDLELSFKIHFPNRNGIIIILGTGSVFAAKVNGKIIKLGGYGRLVGDPGSGYLLGIRVLQQVCRHFDEISLVRKVHAEKRKDTIFEGKIVQRFKSKTHLINKIYQLKFEPQTLAPLLMTCAEKGSPIAKDLIQEAISEVICYLQALDMKVGHHLPIVLLGGLVESSNFFSLNLKRNIKRLRS